MFIKCKSIYNNADLYFNKEKIRLIEDLSTATNLNLRNPSLKIYYNKDDTTSVEFNSQAELQAFLREALS